MVQRNVDDFADLARRRRRTQCRLVTLRTTGLFLGFSLGLFRENGAARRLLARVASSSNRSNSFTRPSSFANRI
jgi:hypothetical protein